MNLGNSIFLDYNDNKGGENMAITVNDKCIGCGVCIEIAPDVFAINDDGVAEVIDEFDIMVNGEEAAQFCPEGAIEIE